MSDKRIRVIISGVYGVIIITRIAYVPISCDGSRCKKSILLLFTQFVTGSIRILDYVNSKKPTKYAKGLCLSRISFRQVASWYYNYFQTANALLVPTFYSWQYILSLRTNRTNCIGVFWLRLRNIVYECSNKSMQKPSHFDVEPLLLRVTSIG